MISDVLMRGFWPRLTFGMDARKEAAAAGSSMRKQRERAKSRFTSYRVPGGRFYEEGRRA
jgi:hypothetical protein